MEATQWQSRVNRRCTTPVDLQELCRRKELSPPSYMRYDSVHITFLKRQNYRSRGQFSGCQGLKRGWGAKEVRGQPKGYPRLVLLVRPGLLPSQALLLPGWTVSPLVGSFKPRPRLASSRVCVTLSCPLRGPGSTWNWGHKHCHMFW